MLRRVIRSMLRPWGYDLVPTRSKASARDGYELCEYLRPDGSFDYDEYRRAQVEANKRKLDYVWVVKDNIRFLSDYLRRRLDNIEFGLCHGTRRGKEQEWFREYLRCEVIGTEISETATQFPHTIQWDFHETRPEWIGAADFIYSNSFDHSYDPQKALDAWMSCLKDDGICIIEHTSADEKANEVDPFGAPVAQMPYLVLKWAQGKYSVREILEAPRVPDILTGMKNEQIYVHYLIIQNGHEWAKAGHSPNA